MPDTNILLYSISRDPTETTKRDRAVALIDAGGNALSVQVLQEFYVQATRATRRDALPHDIAVGLIETWLRFKVQETSVSIMSRRERKGRAEKRRCHPRFSSFREGHAGKPETKESLD